MSKLVIRPGETDFDVQDRVQGALNLPLNDRGNSQVDDIVAALRGRELDVIYASPTEPALSTARRIAEELDLPLKVLDRLANLDLGLWQGLCRKEIRQRQPKVFRQWEEAPASVCPPQGESSEDAISRVRRALQRPLRRNESCAVVACEPLATLVSSLLRGETPRVAGPGDAAERAALIESTSAETVAP
jgi:probable phosphoglycerate mutase